MPVGVVATIADIFEDEQFAAREMLLDADDDEIGPYKTPGIVPKLSASPGRLRWSGRWQPGADNEDVYTGLLGIPADQLEQLREEGIV